jgi:glycosyltransferase involved in cell wall biosynthesis
MKILHVYKDFDPPVHGGIERHMAEMCRHQRQWAEVAALTCSRDGRTRTVERDGVVVHEVAELGRVLSAPLSPTLPLHLRRLAADVTVLHVPNPTAEVAWLVARPRGRLVVRYHSDVVRQSRTMRFYRPFQMQLLGQAAIILPTSQPYLDTSPMLQAFRARCRVVPLGVAPQRFAQPDLARVAALRGQYGDRFVLFSGRHRYYKGLRVLVNAAQRIAAPVVIAGDGPERVALMQQAERLGVPVHFPGRLSEDDLVAHLHACSVFVFPSLARSEAFGLSILEAHACGRPVVATALGTGVEVANLHGQTGLNVAPDDPGALAEAVNTLLADEALRGGLGAFARERVCVEFDVADVARREFELYQEVL